MPIKMGPASSCHVKLRYTDEDILLRVIRAFSALGDSEHWDALSLLAAEVLRFVGHADADRTTKLCEINFPALSGFAVSTAEKHGFGADKINQHKRGVRVVRRNGSIVRVVGSPEGDLDMLFYRMQEKQWTRFFRMLQVSLSTKRGKGWPTWVILMPKIKSFNLKQPFDFC